MAGKEDFTSFEECINYGIDCTEKNDLFNAWNIFNKAMLSYARSQKEENIALLYRGITYLLQGKYTDAAGDLGNVLRYEPNNPKARQMLEIIIQNGDTSSRYMAEKYLGYS